VDECKTLIAPRPVFHVEGAHIELKGKRVRPRGEGTTYSCVGVWQPASAGSHQGLTLVHFAAQPEPFLTLKISPKRLGTPSATTIPSTPPKHSLSHGKRVR